VLHEAELRVCPACGFKLTRRFRLRIVPILVCLSVAGVILGYFGFRENDLALIFPAMLLVLPGELAMVYVMLNAAASDSPLMNPGLAAKPALVGPTLEVPDAELPEAVNWLVHFVLHLLGTEVFD
jgi:hypothetical protein